MELEPQAKFIRDLERTTRILTPKELLDMNLMSAFLETNIPQLLKENPDLTVEMTQKKDGPPLELKIISGGVILFYDNLEAIRGLKIQTQKPKDGVH